MVNICPVCGYWMRFPAADFHICPCCGTEFGYDDAGRTHADLRAQWLRSGAHWWSRNERPPEGWDPYTQVQDAIYGAPIWKVLVGRTIASVSGESALGDNTLLNEQQDKGMGRIPPSAFVQSTNPKAIFA
jgi:hypothetical protein